MNSITYSFIIPHKNCPDLLSRCVGSIPCRKDIQIIVVDDNSDVDKKPVIDRDGVDLILLDAEHAKGAGRARNIGLSKANGRWILFADSDDFYNPGFLNYLDYYKESDFEIIFFSANSRNSDTLEEIKGRSNNLDRYIKEALEGNPVSINKLKYLYRSPWFKMISYDYIYKHQFTFEEVKRGNDVLFSLNTCYHCKKMAILDEKLYCVTTREGSITYSKKSLEDYYIAISGLLKRNCFYDFIGMPGFKKSIISFVLNGSDNLASNNIFTHVINKFLFIVKFLFVFISKFSVLNKEKTMYVNIVQNS